MLPFFFCGLTTVTGWRCEPEGVAIGQAPFVIPCADCFYFSILFTRKSEKHGFPPGSRTPSIVNTSSLSRDGSQAGGTYVYPVYDVLLAACFPAADHYATLDLWAHMLCVFVEGIQPLAVS